MYISPTESVALCLALPLTAEWPMCLSVLLKGVWPQVPVNPSAEG